MLLHQQKAVLQFYRGKQVTTLYQLSLILENIVQDNQAWMEPTAEFLRGTLERTENLEVKDVEAIKGLMAWEI